METTITLRDAPDGGVLIDATEDGAALHLRYETRRQAENMLPACLSLWRQRRLSALAAPESPDATQPAP